MLKPAFTARAGICSGILAGGLVVYWANRFGWFGHSAFAHCWLNDILAGALFPSLLLLIFPRMNLSEAAYWLLLAVLVWEGAGPWLAAGSVRDPLDLLAYGSGGAVWYLVVRRRLASGGSPEPELSTAVDQNSASRAN